LRVAAMSGKSETNDNPLVLSVVGRVYELQRNDSNRIKSIQEWIAVRRERLLDHNLKIRIKSPTKLHNRTCSVSLFQRVNRIGSNKELDSSGWGLDTRTRKLYYGRKAQKDGLQSQAKSPEGATFS